MIHFTRYYSIWHENRYFLFCSIPGEECKLHFFLVLFNVPTIICSVHSWYSKHSGSILFVLWHVKTWHMVLQTALCSENLWTVNTFLQASKDPDDTIINHYKPDAALSPQQIQFYFWRQRKLPSGLDLSQSD